MAGIVFGLAPAFKTSRTDVNATLNQSGRSLVGSHHRAQAVFVTIEMAMALILLVGAGLMIRTLVRLWNVSPGFNPQHVITFNVTPSASLSRQSPDAIRAAYRQMEATLRSVPGVKQASFDWGARPMLGDWEESFWVEGRPHAERQADLPLSLRYGVEPDYLKLMEIPLLRGRFFTDADNEHSARVVVIDETFAAQYFPGAGPHRETSALCPESLRVVRVPMRSSASWATSSSSVWSLTRPITSRCNTTSPSSRPPIWSCVALGKAPPHSYASRMASILSRCFPACAAP